MNISGEQRARIWERDKGMCIWPQCPNAAREVMHFHSRGFGGRRSANTDDNLGLGCRSHARLSDGESVAGVDYEAEHRKLMPGFDSVPRAQLAWWRAEALRQIAVASMIEGQAKEEA